MAASLILRVLATIAFTIATIVAFGTGTIQHSAALIPLGLALWAGSTLVA